MTDKPIRICYAPGSFAMHGDWRYIKHLLDPPASSGVQPPHIVFVTEAKDYRMKDAIREAGMAGEYVGLQDLTDASTRGCAAAVHASVTIKDWGTTLGVSPYIGKRRVRMLTRYPLWAQVVYGGHWYFPVGVHNAPKRFWQLQAPFLDHVDTLITGHDHAVTGGDWNESLDSVAAHLRNMRVAGGRGIVGALARPGLAINDVKVSYWGVEQHIVDHPSTSLSALPR